MFATFGRGTRCFPAVPSHKPAPSQRLGSHEMQQGANPTGQVIPMPLLDPDVRDTLPCQKKSWRRRT
jgi:hypothetical protein